MLRLSDNARTVLELRYLRRDEARRLIETPDQMFERVAVAVAGAEARLAGPDAASRWRDEFHRALTALEFLPNSPTLMNAGLPLGQLSACFVLPVPDTMEGIFDAVKQMALIQRTGGGTGFSFSRLRPKDDFVASTGGRSSGPVSFLRVFDCATENVKQGGKRRGANMGVLRVDHPDVFEFVGAKLDGTSFRNFNLSVGVTDEFLAAVRDDRPFRLLHPATRQPVRTLPARELFEVIVDAAWRAGDPGLLFLDAIQRANPTPGLGEIEATNPCGEIPLLPYESCNLGSVNLARLLEPGGTAIDWERLAATVRLGVRFLDDVLEVNRYPLPEIGRASLGNRKIGLGVMGFAEVLIRLGVGYGSPESIAFAERLMRFIAGEATAASRELAAERGAFPNWPESVFAARGEPRRNATCTAIAPTGTIGILADTTPGIEPLFALAYRRTHVLEGRTLPEIHPLLLRELEGREGEAREVARKILAVGRLSSIPDVPVDWRHRFVTALDVPVEGHLQIQAAFQRHVDNSVSKTVNLPDAATVRDVEVAYFRAWELGLKGITVYRYGSKTSQVLELGAGEPAWSREHAPHCDPGECGP